MINLPIYYEKQEIGEEKYFRFSKLKRNLVSLAFIFYLLFFLFTFKWGSNFISSFASGNLLSPLQEEKSDHEIFGFAPYWTFDKLDNVDFDVLTTFAYFGIDVNGNGDLDTYGTGYEIFQSDKATEIFKKAHAHGSRTVLTLTLMDNYEIESLLDNRLGQKR